MEPIEELAILRKLRSHGYQALFCGGCVRDSLLHRDPKDWDIVTDATPPEVAALFPTIATGYGVTFVKIPGGKVDVATMRRDIGCDGRHPTEVRYTKELAEDAQRRDFTVNALYWDPIEDRILDPTGLGTQDITDLMIRAVGDPEQRIREDYLRILRAYRFTVQLDFSIESATSDACDAMLRKPGIMGISKERITDEVAKALRYPLGLGIMTGVIRRLGGLIGLRDYDTHRRLLDMDAPVELSFALIVRWQMLLVLSNEQKALVTTVLRNVDRCRRLHQAPVASVLEFIREPHSYYSMVYQAAVDGDTKGLQVFQEHRDHPKLHQEALVGGSDVAAMLPPTPVRQEALRMARRLQDGTDKGREEILSMLEVIYG